jgi:putative transposase
LLQRDSLAMTRCTHLLHHVWYLTGTLLTLLVDIVRFLCLCLQPAPVLAAENLFLRKQLALYQERHVTPRRATAATRLALVWPARWFDWRWKSTPGRLPISADLQALIRRLAWENPTWSQERIANELLLKLGLRISPRTVRKYMPKRLALGPGQHITAQRWRTFVRMKTSEEIAQALDRNDAFMREIIAHGWVLYERVD